MKAIKGKAYVLGNDIDTDQIIPANHLVYDLDDPNERKLYGKFALSGVPEAAAGLPDGYLPFIKEGENTSEYTVIIGGNNFGCGSSREHAPVALSMAGVQAVVAVSYARIFYRNSIDGGFIIPFESENLTDQIQTGNEVEIKNGELINHTSGKVYRLKDLGEVAGIISAGGIFQYAREKGMIS